MQLWRLAKQVQSPLHWQPRRDGHSQDESPLAWAEAFCPQVAVRKKGLWERESNCRLSVWNLPYTGGL